MTCLECGNPIKGRRPDSKYCCKTCSNRAKEKRKNQRLIEGATPVPPDQAYGMANQSLYGFTEIRELEKSKYDTVIELKEKYENQIKALESSNLTKNFKIERLKDKIEDLEKAHERELKSASTNSIKETVGAITQMPAVQGALGALASNLIPSKGDPLGSLENSLSEVEKQILQSLRKMQPESQQYLVQMLYFLFAKEHAEQMEIFTSLMAYMQSDAADNSEDDLP